jgi:transposase
VDCYKETLIRLVLAQADTIGALTGQIEALAAQVAELEAKLGLPPKTPDNSSVPPSRGQKPSEPSAPRPKARPHAGAHRPLHPNPTSRRDVFARRCHGCGADVSTVAQMAARLTTTWKSLRSSPT